MSNIVSIYKNGFSIVTKIFRTIYYVLGAKLLPSSGHTTNPGTQLTKYLNTF